jgi:hypothetical protein
VALRTEGKPPGARQTAGRPGRSALAVGVEGRWPRPTRQRRSGHGSSTRCRPALCPGASPPQAGLGMPVHTWAGIVVRWAMARILLVIGVLEHTLGDQQAWLFEPCLWRVHGTAVTATRLAIPCVSPAGQAGRRGILGLGGKKLRPRGRPHPDY